MTKGYADETRRVLIIANSFLTLALEKVTIFNDFAATLLSGKTEVFATGRLFIYDINCGKNSAPEPAFVIG